MKVLILSDFSHVAINATHYAMDLLQNERVTFTLLNIFEQDPDATEACAEAKRRSTLATIEERVKKLQERSEGRQHEIVGFYSESTLLEAARKFVTENRVDLLVMGAVGKEFQHTTILGNHTFEVMSKVKCNILAVTDNTSFRKMENILMPIDFSASFGKRNIQFLENSKFFDQANLQVCELRNKRDGNHVDSSQKKEVFKKLENVQVEFLGLEEAAIFDTGVLSKVQKKFDLIILLGKNLNIFNGLLHNKHGIYTSVPNRLPIIILHD